MYIEVKGVQKRFGKNRILKDISFNAEKGCSVGILGANGCGKSTLFSILSGVLKADGGEFLLEGRDLNKDSRLLAKQVGYVPQGTPLFEELTAKDNLRLWYDRDSIKKELDGGVLEMLGIGDFLDKRVSKLSGGMKKRLSIGCAVANKPKVLILDEPTAALDLVCKQSISEYLQGFKASGGTILLATHDISELSICDRLFILKDGTLHPYEFDGNEKRLVESL